jgi:hypothetical protein
MERELTDPPTGEHAYMGHHDTSTNSSWCRSWTLGLPAPTGRWRAVCECGWHGDIADTGTIAAIDQDHDPDTDMLDETAEDLLMFSWEIHIGRMHPLARLGV